MSVQNGTSVQTLLDTSNPLNVDEYDTDLEGELAEKQRETYTQISAYDHYMDLCKQHEVVPVSLFIKQMTTEKIDLSFHSIGPDGIKALSAPLATNTTVCVMNLTENFCGAPGCQDLAEMLCENCYITELILKGNDIGKKSQEDGGKALAMIIKENSYIKYLDLSDNYLGDVSAEMFYESLKVNLKLKNLDLSGNDFGEIGSEFLGYGIGANDSLEKLTLSYNKIRGKGAVALAAALKVNISLKHLDLSWNGFRDAGAMNLSESLKDNNSLLTLNLDHNEITDEGLVKLAGALGQNDTLKCLRIGYNDITSKGVIAVLDAVEANSKSAMESLHVPGLVADDDLLDRMISFRDNWNRSRTQLNVAQFEVSELTTFNRKLKAEKDEKAALKAAEQTTDD